MNDRLCETSTFEILGRFRALGDEGMVRRSPPMNLKPSVLRARRALEVKQLFSTPVEGKVSSLTFPFIDQALTPHNRGLRAARISGSRCSSPVRSAFILMLLPTDTATLTPPRLGSLSARLNCG